MRRYRERVGLLGLGTVGTGVVQILQQPRHPLLQSVEIAAVGVRSLDKPRQVRIPPERLTTNLEQIVSDPEIDVVIELMGGLEPARTLILKALDHGKPVITANKAVIARHGEEIFQAAAQAKVSVLLEAAVGGGIPILQPLQQSLQASHIQAVWGIVNGTTNFILSQMTQAASSFEEALALAQAHGYAEADPSADVEGWDAADKIAILASLAFGVSVERAAIPCEGIRGISPTDIRYAREWGYTFKLLAIAQRANSGGEAAKMALDIRVHPTLLPSTHPLANINGVDNAVLVQGDPLGQVVLSGPGAGRGPTASAVVGDLLTLIAHRQTGADAPNPLWGFSCFPAAASLIPLSELESEFYVRVLAQDQPGVMGAIGTCFGRHRVSLESITQKECHQEQAEIVILTHTVREADCRQALAEIQQLPQVAGIPSLFRVLR
ncbi:homoserine dehydrogenase [Synechococcus sp. R55.6]|jgi:homoserine dehydrogenase|uniref:homoserine dehydrogenase n=2 Tax=Synechococcus TaxID=1129 RepID=UPI0039C39DF3